MAEPDQETVTGDPSHSSGGGDHVVDPLNGTTTTNETTTTSRAHSRVPTHTQRPDMGYDHSQGLPYGMPIQQPTWYPWQTGPMPYYGAYATGKTISISCLTL